jgi:rhodanese-related sulfurtransferase
MSNTISVGTLRNWLEDGHELAVLDIRDPETVGYASPLFATNLPAERVEAELARFVPRKGVRTVLVDDGSGVAEELVDTLATVGWTQIVAVDGGIPAWGAQADTNVPTFDTPGNDFSLSIRDENNTPAVTAQDLQALRAEGADVIVIDTRTLPEYVAGHVPGAVGVPGAELLLRFSDVVPSPDTHVVVSCAGLPRAIIGAQTLIDGGVPNPVSFLYDGTKAWKETGSALEAGPVKTYVGVVAAAGAAAEDAGERVAERVRAISATDQIPRIDLATATAWAADPDRTTYLLDVRTPEEYDASHVPGSIPSEGGQLLGVAYRTIAVRGARVVLVDDLIGARAAVVAHWLKRRGYEIAILLHDFERAA